MKIWKKEDFINKYIYIDSSEKQKKVEKFLEELGFYSDLPWNDNHNPTKGNCKYFAFTEDKFYYLDSEHGSIPIKYEDLQLDNKEIIFSIF